jgi:hypothetical protein
MSSRVWIVMVRNRERGKKGIEEYHHFFYKIMNLGSVIEGKKGID